MAYFSERTLVFYFMYFLISIGHVMRMIGHLLVLISYFLVTIQYIRVPINKFLLRDLRLNIKRLLFYLSNFIEFNDCYINYVTFSNSLSIHCDNIEITYLCANHVFYSRTKHIIIYFQFVHDKVKNGKLRVSNVLSSNQFVNPLTKFLFYQ